ncbi:MAG: nicotinate-nucleotide adenylyltransferase [Lachnospiraceae bacterium]|nr:nicotinate-nucleotide adenylyltransferase [Lachnospiraceae bacterium]
MDRKKIGIMGGTFDPIHIGHLLMANAAREYFRLDEILFIPSGNPYFKEHITDKQRRYEMVSLAIEDNKSFTISDIEINRPGNTYSYETLEELTREHPENRYYFIVGADSVFYMEQWKNIEQLFHCCTIAVAVRDGYSVDELKVYMNKLMTTYPNCRIELFNTSRFDISSTEIRDHIATGHSVQYLVPDKVLSYINENHIYR